MKVSEDLSILIHLRYDNKNPNGKATICVRFTVTGFPRDGFSLGYQVDPPSSIRVRLYYREISRSRKWVEVVIHAEYRHAADEFKSDYKQRLVDNKTIFS